MSVWIKATQKGDGCEGCDCQPEVCDKCPTCPDVDTIEVVLSGVVGCCVHYLSSSDIIDVSTLNGVYYLEKQDGGTWTTTIFVSRKVHDYEDDDANFEPGCVTQSRTGSTGILFSLSCDLTADGKIKFGMQLTGDISTQMFEGDPVESTATSAILNNMTTACDGVVEIHGGTATLSWGGS